MSCSPSKEVVVNTGAISASSNETVPKTKDDDGDNKRHSHHGDAEVLLDEFDEETFTAMSAIIAIHAARDNYPKIGAWMIFGLALFKQYLAEKKKAMPFRHCTIHLKDPRDRHPLGYIDTHENLLTIKLDSNKRLYEFIIQAGKVIQEHHVLHELLDTAIYFAGGVQAFIPIVNTIGLIDSMSKAIKFVVKNKSEIKKRATDIIKLVHTICGKDDLKKANQKFHEQEYGNEKFEEAQKNDLSRALSQLPQFLENSKKKDKK